MTTTTPPAATPDIWVLITDLSGLLLELTGTLPAGGYRKLLVRAQSGELSPPMAKRNGRWGCLASQLPELAVRVGLTPKAPPAAARTRTVRQKPDTAQQAA